MKCKRGEFDLGDFVNDIHHRLNNGNFEGDQMDFVYIDEVQDLSIRQISLFKYVCPNVDEGFFFAGDTAQTIARGIDFRFQDIRSLFYREFLIAGTSGKPKGLVSEIQQLKQNFRTHLGVLDLAQSVIDLLYHYFAHSIDSLEPETSLVSGEAPVLLESGDDENAIATIFGGGGNGVEIVGFGAEQVILVRDEHMKAEICEYVGRQALVLTIVECKGLEFQFFYENNFVLATLCFERAGDTMWVKMAKASHLRASADQMRGTNREAFLGYVREAAEMFESIGKLEYAASCYCDLGEYERAGKMYLHTPGKIDAAAEYFSLAGGHSEAAEAYAKGDQFSNCLWHCKKGKLFDRGLEYIKYWKESVNFQSKEFRQIVQECLESCAFEYHGHDDPKSMMKFVQAFYFMESKRVFLRSLGCLDDLLLLEEESGKFLEAAELASSLWENGNSGWPLKQFPQKEVHCEKAKLLAKMESDVFYDFVSKKQESKERNLIRKLLDKHLHLNVSKYEWEDELPIDMNKHCEEKMFQNKVSIRTLVYYWNSWKEKVVHIFGSLESFHNEEPHKDELYVYFSLIYFGVRKHHVNGNMVYLLVNKDANWVRKWGQKGLHIDGNRLIIDGRELVFAIRSYWQLELLTVGIKVLETLEALRKSKSNGPAFHQSISLLHMFEVSKFLLGCQYLNLTNPYIKKLQCFLGISLTYFDLVFPLDWRKSVSKDFISLRETELSVNLLDEIILHYVDMKGDFTYWKIGRVMMICLGLKTWEALYEHIINKLDGNPTWKSLNLRDDGLENFDVSLLHRTFEANWKFAGYISPDSFVHLLDRLLFVDNFLSETFYNTRSSFVGWLTYVHSPTTPTILFPDKKQESSPLDILFYVHAPDISKVLINLLSDHKHLLPNKFVSNLLRGREGQTLILNPEMVGEAFSSIDDPLVIVCSRDARPNIHAPCAIFVELTNSREEIMNANLIVNPVDGCRRELRMKWKDLKRMSKKIKVKIPPTLKNEFDIYLDALATALEDEKFRTGEYITLVHYVYSELKALLEAFNPSPTTFRSYENLMEWPERSRPKLDDFLKCYGKSQNPKSGQMVVLECSSSTTGVEQTSV
ncbi:UvrD-like helicase, ATP-binding domain, P-loop containing nucleoside triphosphate hydrolase [Tanacetum coccineum]